MTVHYYKNHSKNGKKLCKIFQLNKVSLYIEDDNRFMFLTEIKNVGKPNVEIDVKYSERDRTERYGLLAITALSYTEKHLIRNVPV
jgi:hypothetical protein